MKMKKNAYEIKRNLIATVEDLGKVLLECPKDYTINPMGEQCAIAVDHYHKCIYIDNPNFIDSYESELKETIESNDDSFKIEVEDSKLVPFAPDLFVLMGYEDICQNGNAEAQLYGVFSSEELANEAGRELVSLGNILYYEVEAPTLDEFGWR